MASRLINLNRWFFWAILGLFLLFLFHFESVSIGPLKVSHLWKGALLGLLMVKVFSGGRIRSSIYNPFFLLALLIFFSLEIIYNPLNAVFTFLTVIIIPLIGVYALGKDPVWCKKALHFLAAFFILCFVPYEMGLLTPLGEGYDLERSFGLTAQGTIGPFQTVHSASTALAGALLVILYFLLTSACSRVWLIFLFLLGLYLLINTYVRTGMAMFAVGALIMLGSFAVRNLKMFLRVSLLAMAMVPLASTWVLSNDAVIARIVGERSHSSELDSFETMGSGRGGMALDTLEIYAEANLIEKIIGMGITEQKRRMAEKRGHQLVPHNGFLALLVHLGFFGFILFFLFLGRLWISIGLFKRSQSRTLLRSLFFAYLVMTFFQTYDMLYMPVLMMLSYAWKRNISSMTQTRIV